MTSWYDRIPTYVYVIVFIVALIIVLVGIALANHSLDPLIMTNATVKGTDGPRTYRVCRFRNPKERQEAAHSLDALRLKLQRVLDAVEDPEMRAKIDSTPLDLRDLCRFPGLNTVGSTVQKKRIHVCVDLARDDQDEARTNAMMYIGVHELAHFLTDKYGHEHDEFWELFRTLLHKAVDLGLYTPRDYSKEPISYCGYELTDNILFG